MIDNWSERKEGSVKAVHHSTSSVIELVITDDEGLRSSVWLDYYQFEDLVKLISSLK